jgi:GT2 family glycosyltransferase
VRHSVDIAIVHWANSTLTRQAVESAVSAVQKLEARSIGSRVLVVSTPGGVPLRWSDRVDDDSVSYVELAKNDGYGAACNHAAEMSHAALLAVANNDLVLEGDGFADLVEECLAMRDDRWVAATGQIRLDNGGFQDMIGTTPTLRTMLSRAKRSGELVDDPELTGHWYAVNNVSAVLLCLNRAAFLELGGFDSAKYFMYYEDADLCRRILGAKRQVMFYDRVIGRHQRGASTSVWPEEARLLAIRTSQARYVRTHFRAWLRPLYVAGAIAQASTAAVSGSAHANLGTRLRVYLLCVRAALNAVRGI